VRGNIILSIEFTLTRALNKEVNSRLRVGDVNPTEALILIQCHDLTMNHNPTLEHIDLTELGNLPTVISRAVVTDHVVDVLLSGS
jgi:hypothetical protein